MWDNRFRNDVGNVCKVSVDGTDFRIYEKSPFWKGWFSHKFNGPALRYEVAVCIQSGEIVWFSGPHPAGKWTDLKIFRLALKYILQAGEMVEADRGYRGEPLFIKTPSGDNDDQAKLVRSRHETVNRRFKQWNCLSRVYRHHLTKHQSVFAAVASITQLSLEHGAPLFSVEYHD